MRQAGSVSKLYERQDLQGKYLCHNENKERMNGCRIKLERAISYENIHVYQLSSF
jgi:hypothetical protein